VQDSTHGELHYHNKAVALPHKAVVGHTHTHTHTHTHLRILSKRNGGDDFLQPEGSKKEGREGGREEGKEGGRQGRKEGGREAGSEGESEGGSAQFFNSSMI